MDHPVHPEAVAHLRGVDPVLGRLIDRVGRATPGPRTEGTHLGAIARAIVFQQLSGRAAGTIHGRFEALFGGRAPTAEELLAVPEEQLRSVGLSRAKTLYLKDLAQRVVDGSLPIDRLQELDDAALLEALTAVKGIGRWTAQIFLMFRLGRPNVLPDLDLGVRKAIQLAYGLRQLPTPNEVILRGAIWSPYASFAAWYLWRSLELPDAASMRTRRATKAAKQKRTPRKSARKSKRGVAGRGPARHASKRGRVNGRRPAKATGAGRRGSSRPKGGPPTSRKR
jgi:DNA-3-methyladenine glycosylase II